MDSKAMKKCFLFGYFFYSLAFRFAKASDIAIDTSECQVNDKKYNTYENCPYDFVLTFSEHTAGLDMDGKVYSKYLSSKHVHYDEELSEYTNDVRVQELIEKGICPSNRVRIYLENNPMFYMYYVYLTQQEKDTGKFHRDSITRSHNDRQFMMVNPELFRSADLMLPELELLMCKTRQCVDYMKAVQVELLETKTLKRKVPIWYTGFTTEIELDAGSSRLDFNKMLHAAGKSPYKGTYHVLAAWYKRPDWPKLTFQYYNNKLVDLVANNVFNMFQNTPENIDINEGKIPLEEFNTILQTHGIHIIPSDVEGFGHALNEARALGALVVTTNYPAMNELFEDGRSAVLVQPAEFLGMPNPSVRTLMPVCMVSSENVEVAIDRVLSMTVSERREMGLRARESYERGRDSFEQNMKQLRCMTLYQDNDINCQQIGTLEKCAQLCGVQFE